MRVLVISDIHSNIEALFAIFEQENNNYNEIWCLGDITGYGPNPRECINLLMQKQSQVKIYAVMGNHDRIISRKETPLGFNQHAIIAAYKNIAKLTENESEWLANLPFTTKPRDNILICHGSPLYNDEYLLSLNVAEPHLIDMVHKNFMLTLFGHTHIPTIYAFDYKADKFYEEEFRYNEPIALKTTHTVYMINPGSIGQPRDGNPTSCYLLLDISEDNYQDIKITFKRSNYDIRKCQSKMMLEGFPQILIDRLSVGY